MVIVCGKLCCGLWVCLVIIGVIFSLVNVNIMLDKKMIVFQCLRFGIQFFVVVQFVCIWCLVYSYIIVSKMRLVEGINMLYQVLMLLIIFVYFILWIFISVNSQKIIVELILINVLFFVRLLLIIQFNVVKLNCSINGKNSMQEKRK